jgi:chromosome segregation ATPase
MATQTVSAADQVAEMQARSHTLETEHTEAVATRADATQRLARAAADGASEDVRGGIRSELRDLNARIEEIDAALPLIRLDLQPLEAQVAEARRVAAEAKAGRLRAEYVEAVRTTEATARKMATEFLAVRGKQEALYEQALTAAQEAVRAAGGDRYDVWNVRVTADDALGTNRDYLADYGLVVRALLAYGSLITRAEPSRT